MPFDRPPCGHPVQRPAVWIIVADECLILSSPIGHDCFLLRSVADLDQAAVFGRGLHVAEGG